MRTPQHHPAARYTALLACVAIITTLLSGCLGPDVTPTATAPAGATPSALATNSASPQLATGTPELPPVTPTEMAAGRAGTADTAGASEAEPPGWPGNSAYWTTGSKQGLGTAVSGESKVWYTLADGALTEVYYPRGDTSQVRQLEFAVTDGSSFVERETESTTHRITLVDPRSLTYEQVNTSKSGRYRLTKRYVTDPVRSTVLVQVSFEPLTPGPYSLYVLYDPAIGNSTLHDTATRSGSGTDMALIANQGTLAASALVSSSGFARTSNGFVGKSDGWADLKAHHRLEWNYSTARDGNVLQTGEIPLGEDGKATFTLALGFGQSPQEAESTARASLAQPFSTQQSAYQEGWHGYLNSLPATPKALTDRLATQYNVSVMTIKAHEDKTFPGAFIASLTLPWGFNVSADDSGGGYHFVWARDLYHQATAMLAAGDRAATDRAVTWLFTHQQLRNGTFPQNSKVNGTPDQTNLQLDEVAFPIVLAWQLGRKDDATWEGIRKAADVLVLRGPATPQERWEETDGYSPSTLAAEIAGLVAAGDLARQRGDNAHAALWNAVADDWQRNAEKWMFTTNGSVGDGHYYVRIDNNGDPNDGSLREYANGAGLHKENSVLDAGFLELVRLGVKAADDKYVADAIPETDASLAKDTPSGRVWYRYTYDGYGEKPTGGPWAFNSITYGRPWPILAGERGEYEVANGRDALAYLQTMANTANDGYMIPEQVWDKPEPTSYGYQAGKGTGSAAPLAWAMAQYVRLARSIEAGHPIETPAVVAARYAQGAQRSVPTLQLSAPTEGTPVAEAQAVLRGTTDAPRVYVSTGGDVKEATPQNGAFEISIPLESGSTRVTVVAEAADGGTAMQQVTVTH